MLNRILFLALSAAVLARGPVSAGALPLVIGGEPVSILVLSDEPTEAAREAAGALRTWIEKMSGARLPVLHESDVAPNPASTLILVGETERTRALGIDPEGLGLEEVRVRTFPGAVAVLGDDLRPDGLPLRGTLFAAGLFAREVLGIRWLWPDELGEVVPQRREISVPEVRIRQTPRFRRRDMFNQAYNGVCHTKIDALGWDHEPFVEMQRRTDGWQAFHGGGGSYRRQLRPRLRPLLGPPPRGTPRLVRPAAGRDPRQRGAGQRGLPQSPALRVEPRSDRAGREGQDRAAEAESFPRRRLGLPQRRGPADLLSVRALRVLGRPRGRGDPDAQPGRPHSPRHPERPFRPLLQRDRPDRGAGAAGPQHRGLRVPPLHDAADSRRAPSQRGHRLRDRHEDVRQRGPAREDAPRVGEVGREGRPVVPLLQLHLRPQRLPERVRPPPGRGPEVLRRERHRLRPVRLRDGPTGGRTG